jgi:hypothetical protein
VGHFPCYTTRTPRVPRLIFISPPGPDSIIRVPLSPQPPLRVFWCHMFPNIPDSNTMSSMSSAPFVA